MSGHSLEYVMAGCTFAGMLVAIVAVIAGWRTLRSHQRVAKADFYLRLDEHIRAFQDIDFALREDDAWKTFRLDDAKIRGQVNAYMGFFERLQVMVDDKIIERKDLKTFYEYRYMRLIANEAIAHRWLENRRIAVHWQQFLKFGLTLTDSRDKQSMCQALKVKTGYCASDWNAKESEN